jgi:hypothetical protein
MWLCTRRKYTNPRDCTYHLLEESMAALCVPSPLNGTARWRWTREGEELPGRDGVDGGEASRAAAAADESGGGWERRRMIAAAPAVAGVRVTMLSGGGCWGEKKFFPPTSRGYVPWPLIGWTGQSVPEDQTVWVPIWPAQFSNGGLDRPSKFFSSFFLFQTTFDIICR